MDKQFSGIRQSSKINTVYCKSKEDVCKANKGKIHITIFAVTSRTIGRWQMGEKMGGGGGGQMPPYNCPPPPHTPALPVIAIDLGHSYGGLGALLPPPKSWCPQVPPHKIMLNVKQNGQKKTYAPMKKQVPPPPPAPH